MTLDELARLVDTLRKTNPGNTEIFVSGYYGTDRMTGIEPKVVHASYVVANDTGTAEVLCVMPTQEP